MSLKQILPVTLVVLVTIALALWFFDRAVLPDFFPWSGVVLPAVLTFVLALGLALLLPDGLFYTRAERMRLDLYTATGLQAGASERVLAHVELANGLAGRLRKAVPELREDAAALVEAGAEDLEGLAARLYNDPGRAASMTRLIQRGELVVESVETFVRFKSDVGADADSIDAARVRIMETLGQMSDAADAEHMRLARQKLTDLEVATEVADSLIGRKT